MLRFLGSSQTFCDGVSRRNFLQIGAFGAGLTLADMLRREGRQRRGQREAALAGRNKSAIMIYLPGGPSHMDMYDLKPDAPDEFRGEFKPDRHQRPRRADLRALPAAGQDVGQARLRPLASSRSTSTPTRS